MITPRKDSSGKQSKAKKPKPQGKKSQGRPGPTANAHLIAWGEEQVQRGVPYFLVEFAQEAALTARQSCEMLQMLTSGALAPYAQNIRAEEWAEFYRRPDRHLQSIGDTVSSFEGWTNEDEPGIGTCLRFWGVGDRAWQRLDKETRLQIIQEVVKEIREMQRAGQWQVLMETLQEVQRSAWREHCAELARGDVDDKDYSQFPGDSPEMQFFIRVSYPCQMLYGEGAHQLFCRAEAGEVDAVERLIRLDKKVLLIPEIARWLSRWQDAGRSDVMDIVGQSFRDLKGLRTTILDQKLKLLALLWQASSRLPETPLFRFQRFQWSDLRSLCDAVAKDQGRQCDEDVPASDEALKKAVQRTVKKQSLAAWDMFSRKSVP